MKKNKKNLGSDLTRVDAHVIQPHEYEELPEWTNEMFDRADLYYGGVLIRRGKRGRPKKPSKARAKTISLRLDPKLNAYFRATGKGWQTRINKILAEWIKKHPLPR